MPEKTLFMLINLTGTLIASFSQVLLKKEAQLEHDSWIKEYLNVRVIVAYILFFIGACTSLISLRVLNLSLVTVLESAGYIFILILSAIFFKEKPTWNKLVGLVLILGGILLYIL